MYHIKTDKRAEKSVELICTGLLACLEQKPFSQISISDIQRASTVSRSTFYRNFDSLDDVLALLCDRGFDEILRSGSDALNLAAFHYWYAHGRLLEAILSSGKTAVFTSSLRRCIARAGHVSALFADAARFDYFSSTVAHVMLGILAAWIERGKKESEDELLLILRDSFSAVSLLGLMT